MSDGLGDRCKAYEQAEAGHSAMRCLPLLARLDGRAFHTFTRGLRRPYDEAMSRSMIETARQLVGKTHAAVGYTQSDEITLAWHQPGEHSQLMFNGRFQKLASVLAGLASVAFYKEIAQRLPSKAGELPHFDCRVWQVPTIRDAIDVFIWREDDATKNSIAMAAQSVCSHKELHGKHTGDMQEMLHDKGINWNDYPAFFKRGTYLQRKTSPRTLTEVERIRIPEAHRPESDATFERSEVVELDMPPIRRIPPGDRVAALFGGAPAVEYTS